MPRIFDPFAGDSLETNHIGTQFYRKRRRRNKNEPKKVGKAKNGDNDAGWNDNNACDKEECLSDASPAKEDKAVTFVKTMPNGEISPPRALIFDTRVIGTAPGNEIGASVCKNYHTLLYHLEERGILPSLLVVTELSQTGQTHLAVETYSKRQLQEQLQKKATFLHQASVETNQDTDGKPVQVPKALTAKMTWRALSAMVNVVSEQISHTPTALTLVTTDVALFCETDRYEHESAFELFWNKACLHFGKAIFSSISIILVKTNGLCWVDPEETQCDNVGQHYDKVFAANLHAIQTKLDQLSQKEYQLTSLSAVDGSTLNISISVIENNAVGYQSLCRQWTRNILGMQSVRRRLTFELPKTNDGTQCKLSFDMTYQSLPFTIDSSDCHRLKKDLEYLSLSTVKIIQAVPTTSIDVTILYGIPILLTTGLEEDFDQYQMMVAMVQSFIRTLQDREIALLVQVDNVEKIGHNISKTGMFHALGQLYFLLPQERPKSSGVNPDTAILFPVACGNHLLADTSPPVSAKILNYDQLHTSVQYIDHAIDFLKCEPFNPLYFVAVDNATYQSHHDTEGTRIVQIESLPPFETPRISAVNHVARIQEPTPLHTDCDMTVASNHSDFSWNDDTGIGSLPVPNAADVKGESVDGVAECDMFPYD